MDFFGIKRGTCEEDRTGHEGEDDGKCNAFCVLNSYGVSFERYRTKNWFTLEGLFVWSNLIYSVAAALHDPGE